MLHQEEIQHHNKQLAQYRHNLSILLQQEGLKGGSQYDSLELFNSIEVQRVNIRRQKDILRQQYYVFVEDLPDDEREDSGAVYQQQFRVSLGTSYSFTRIVGTFPIVTDIRQYLQATSSTFDSLYSYKSLHYLFQHLEDSYKACAFEYRNEQLIRRRIRWDSLKKSIGALKNCIKKIIKYVAEYSVVADTVVARNWLPLLKRVVDLIDQVIEEQNVDQLTELNRYITYTLGQQPSRVNILLVGVAGELKLPVFIALMESFIQQIDNTRVPSELARMIAHLRQDSVDLRTRLSGLHSLVHIHDNFQKIDDELREMEKRSNRSASEMRFRWQSQQGTIEELCNCQQEWVPMLRMLTDKINSTIMASESSSIRNLFIAYQSQISQIFFDLNTSMINACEELRNSDSSLQRMQRALIYE